MEFSDRKMLSSYLPDFLNPKELLKKPKKQEAEPEVQAEVVHRDATQVMLSREEFNILKQQLVEMTEEKEGLEKQIQALLPTKEEIDNMKKQIKSIKQKMKNSEERYRRKEDYYAQQMESAKDIKAQPRSISIGTLLEKLPLSNIQEETQHVALTAKLNSEKERLKELEDEEIESADNLASIAAVDQSLQFQIEETQRLVTKIDMIAPKIYFCRNAGFYVEDLYTKFEQCTYERNAQKGRKRRFKQWIKSTQDVIDHHNQTLSSYDKDLERIANNQIDAEKILKDTEAQLAAEQLRQSEMTLSIADHLAEDENLAQKFDHEKADMIADNEQRRDQIEIIEQQSIDISNIIANYHVNHKKLVNKKLNLIRELEKRVKAERRIQADQSIVTDYVEKLTIVLANEMSARDAIDDHNKKLDDSLKRLQREAEKKKSLIAEYTEITPANEPMSEERCMEEFRQLVQDHQVQNQFYLKEMVSLQDELNCLESENRSLKGIASQIP